MTDLAVLVDKSAVDPTLSSLRAEGIYDDSRRLLERGDRIEIPVTRPPERTHVQDVVRQVDPQPRITDLPTLLEQRGFTEDEIAAAPSSWSVIGEVIIARFEGCERREAVGEALLELHRGAETVLDTHGVTGEYREPDVEVVAGTGETETVHVEHGTEYGLDLAKVMFSPGNKAERVRMGEVLDPGERVLDMFAGIGYFTLPMARAGASVTAIEKNRVAFRYLSENARRNDVNEQVALMLGDCREVIATRSAAADAYDRIVMGYYDAFEYLQPALEVLRSGGHLHMHEATPTALLPDRPIDRLEAAARAADRSVRQTTLREVKTHAEGVTHVVADAEID